MPNKFYFSPSSGKQLNFLYPFFIGCKLPPDPMSYYPFKSTLHPYSSFILSKQQGFTKNKTVPEKQHFCLVKNHLLFSQVAQRVFSGSTGCQIRNQIGQGTEDRECVYWIYSIVTFVFTESTPLRPLCIGSQ